MPRERCATSNPTWTGDRPSRSGGTDGGHTVCVDTMNENLHRDIAWERIGGADKIAVFVAERFVSQSLCERLAHTSQTHFDRGGCQNAFGGSPFRRSSVSGDLIVETGNFKPRSFVELCIHGSLRKVF